MYLHQQGVHYFSPPGWLKGSIRIRSAMSAATWASMRILTSSLVLLSSWRETMTSTRSWPKPSILQAAEVGGMMHRTQIKAQIYWGGRCDCLFRYKSAGISVPLPSLCPIPRPIYIWTHDWIAMRVLCSRL